jgi:SAM-dependent methyltransferase
VSDQRFVCLDFDMGHSGLSNEPYPPSRNETVEQVKARQRLRFNELWREGRSQPSSADRIRYRIWRKYLVAPILDIGAGDGLLARTFSSQQVVSVDQAAHGLRVAPDPRIVATFESLPIKAGVVRTIVAAEVLEHTGDPLAALAECRRIARPDATLLVSVPLFPVAYSEAVYHRLRIGKWPTEANLARWDPEHERRYQLDSLLAQLAKVGWVPMELVPLFGSATTALFYFGEPATNKLVGRRLQLAQYGATLDRLWTRFDRHSDIAAVCRLQL